MPKNDTKKADETAPAGAGASDASVADPVADSAPADGDNAAAGAAAQPGADVAIETVNAPDPVDAAEQVAAPAEVADTEIKTLQSKVAAAAAAAQTAGDHRAHALFSSIDLSFSELKNRIGAASDVDLPGDLAAILAEVKALF